MRRIDRLQMLTTSTTDINGFTIPPDVIDWSRYEKNPVLLYDKINEGHKGVVIGKVEDLQRVGNGWAGRLAFMERFEDADIAFEKYSQGVLTFTSIGGFAQLRANSKEVLRYLPQENSLVKLPANIECGQLNLETLSADDKRAVEGLQQDGTEIIYLTMSINMDENAINQPDAPVVVEAEAQPDAPVVVEAETQPLPNGMTWHEQENNTNQQKFINMDRTFRQLNCDADFQRRMNQLNSAFRTGASAADNTPENVETVRLMASAMLNDERMVVLASAAYFTDAVTRQRVNGLQTLLECSAGGAAAATLAAADLGVIKWLSLFYEKLLPNDNFRRSIRFVPMSDRTGAIFVESGINPATYIGAVTPLNVANYLYDDIKRTIARQVFSIQPVTFQHADMAVLAYDKQSLGWNTAMDSLMADIATYWLQVAANTPSLSKVPTTGTTFSSSGLFPIEAPISNVNIKGVAANDILMTEGVFLVQNYNLESRAVEIVLPSNLFTKLVTDDRFQTILTPQMSGSTGGGYRYSGSKISQRNPVARYNTTSGMAELDPSLYADNNVANDGTTTAITPATTTANHVGCGVAFVENELIAGIGTIDVIVAPDPKNYGLTMSGWVSTGATMARQNGVGGALIVPTVVTP